VIELIFQQRQPHVHGILFIGTSVMFRRLTNRLPSDEPAAEAAAVTEFNLDDEQRKRLVGRDWE
jgi:hypothetical protein